MPFRPLRCEPVADARFDGDLRQPVGSPVILTRRDLVLRHPFDPFYRPGPQRREDADYQLSLFVHGHDIWITKKRDGELKYTDLPKYVKKGESIMDTDVVLWHSTPAYHMPRSEDGIRMGQAMQGAIQVMWSGFALKPHQVHDSTPHHP